MDDAHLPLLRQALDLAREAAARGDHPFGALLARQGRVVLRARNTVHSERDCTRRAELNLVSRACRELAPWLDGHTLYTSTEPCAMCAGAIYWAGVSRVVYACPAEALDRVAGPGLALPCREVFARGDRPVEVVGPLLQQEAVALHEAYWPRP